jgi:hypothetical protein
MKHPKVSPEQQDFIKSNSSNLSIIEIAQQLGLQRNKVYRSAYALGVEVKGSKRYDLIQDDTIQDGMFDYTQHENWLV